MGPEAPSTAKANGIVGAALVAAQGQPQGLPLQGNNVLALRLPENFLGYRVYLTGREPAKYPYLGEGLNAQWADFVRWLAWVHQRSVRRGIEAIRETARDTEALLGPGDREL